MCNVSHHRIHICCSFSYSSQIYSSFGSQFISYRHSKSLWSILRHIVDEHFVNYAVCTCMYMYFQGAKNHGVIMPDANKEATLNAVSIHTCFNMQLLNASHVHSAKFCKYENQVKTCVMVLEKIMTCISE